MSIIVEIITILLMILIFFQDVKSRMIHILLPLGLFLVGMFYRYDLQLDYISMLYSLLFVVVVLLGLFLYTLLKKNDKKSFNKSIGLGDILFFIAVIPFFDERNYFLFFITGMLFSLLAFIILSFFTKSELIPLAGFLALYFIVLKILSYSINLNLFLNPII